MKTSSIVKNDGAKRNQPGIINVSGYSLSSQEAETVSQIILENPSAHTINLYSAGLTPENFWLISSAMRNLTSLTSIDLGDNSEMTSTENQAIHFINFACQVVSSNPSLTSLSLSKIGINFCSKAIDRLEDALKGKALKFLDLSYNYSTGNHCLSFKEGSDKPNLAFYDTVTSKIYFSETLVPVSNIIKNHNLVSLILDNICLIPNSATTLASGLKNHPTLEYLDLSHNHFGLLVEKETEDPEFYCKPCGLPRTPESFVTLMAAIAPSKTLRHLGFKKIWMNIDSFAKMLKILKIFQNTTLSSIDLSDNMLWGGHAYLTSEPRQVQIEETPITLVAALKDDLAWKLQSLDSLDLSYTFGLHRNEITQYTKEAIKTFGNILQDQHNLKKLNLSLNSLDDEMLMYLIKPFQGKNLEELDLSFNPDLTKISSIMLRSVLKPNINLIMSTTGRGESIEPFADKAVSLEFHKISEILAEAAIIPPELARIIAEYYCAKEVADSEKFIVPGEGAKEIKNISSNADRKVDHPEEVAKVPVEVMLELLKTFLMEPVMIVCDYLDKEDFYDNVLPESNSKRQEDVVSLMGNNELHLSDDVADDSTEAIVAMHL